MKKLITLFIAYNSLFAMSAKQNIQSLTITGKIGVYGNEPHTFIAIKENNKLYRIKNAKEFNLNKMQNKTVKVEAVKIKEKVGPNFPAVINIVKIIKN